MGKRGTSTGSSKKASSKTQKKSKGPKGKKARAKAKLERQWGEHVLVDPGDAAASKKSSWRMGPSRLLHQQQRQKKKDGEPMMTTRQEPEILTKDEEEDDVVNSHEGEDSSRLGFDDESESGDEEDAAQCYSTLLHSIRERSSKSGRQHKNAAMDVVFDDDDDDDDDDASNSTGSTGDDEKEASAHQCMEEDDESYLNVTIPSVDPFTARFSPREELPESTVKENASSRHKEMVKINSGSDSKIVDVQVSQHLAETLQLPTCAANDKTSSSTTSGEDHNQRAYKFLKSFYRPVLQGNTMRDKKGWLRRPYHHHNIVFPVLSSYADMLWTTSENLQGKNYQLSEMILAHTLNHVVTSRTRIYRHDKRLLEEDSDDVDINTKEDDAWKRDQGFTRPTVLILLPTRHCCYQVVQRMQTLLSCSTATSSGNHDDSTLQRFAMEYGPPPPPPADAIVDEAQERHRQKVLRQKGPAWNALFGDDCNSDDDFKVGLALHLGKKQSKNNNDESSNISIKLFTDFYRSDIILASPLGLKMAIDDSPDFLSSIEICVVDRAEVLLEQNWDHVHDVLGMLNQQPRSHNETDFSRVRPYFLQPDISQHFRQVVVCSTVLDPAILSTFKRYSQSVSGVVRVKERYPVEQASVSNLVLSTSSNGDAIRQAFQRVPCTSFATQSDDRVNYFVERVLPHLERTQQTHTMVFIPSYFDFLSLRNALMQRQKDYATALNFVSVTEYARATEVSRGRARFLQGRRPLLLYTGRAHFFLRHHIRGVRHLIFLGLPVHADFYVEHVNRLLQAEDNEGIDDRDIVGDASAGGASTCLALYTPYEAHALERIVGTANCSRMVQGEKATHIFSSS